MLTHLIYTHACLQEVKREATRVSQFMGEALQLSQLEARNCHAEMHLAQ